MKIFLSASVPLPGRDKRFIETADVVGIREAVKGLVHVIMERGDHLIFGGHPAITPMVRLLFLEAGKAPGQNVLPRMKRSNASLRCQRSTMIGTRACSKCGDEC